MKLIAIYIIDNIDNPESLLSQMVGKPVRKGNKIIGQILEAKINRKGQLEFEWECTDSYFEKCIAEEKINYGIKFLGEE